MMIDGLAACRALQTAETEAAAKAGCRFCAFVVSRLTQQSVLDAFRKIEMRLRILGDHGTASLSIQNLGYGRSTQLLWVNFPGKTATHSYEPGARAAIFASHIVSPQGELENLCVNHLFI